MTEFRPRVSAGADERPRRAVWPWLAGGAALVALAAALLLGGDDMHLADRTAIKATRAAGDGAPATRSPVTDLPPPEPYAPDPAGRAVLEQLTLAPAPAKSGGMGYVVTKADAELLAHTALREGDVLLELDGQKLDPARIERLGEELGDYDDVWVSFERGGKKQEMLLELRRR